MEIWVGVLTAVAVVSAGLWLLSAQAARERALDLALGRLGFNEDEDTFNGFGFKAWLVRLAARVTGQHSLAVAAERLKWAGSSFRAEEFYAAKFGAALVGGGLVLSMGMIGLGPVGIGLAVAVSGLAFITPNFWLTRSVRARQRAVERQLLGFVDMLVVACDAGLNLSDALLYVADRMGGVLGQEIRRAGSEVRLGATRARALLAAADRLGHPTLTRVCQEIVQVEKTGTPVVNILRQQGALVRQERRLQAQELAQKATVKLWLPVVLLVFVPTMILVAGPAVLNVLRVLQ